MRLRQPAHVQENFIDGSALRSREVVVSNQRVKSAARCERFDACTAVMLPFARVVCASMFAAGSSYWTNWAVRNHSIGKSIAFGVIASHSQHHSETQASKQCADAFWGILLGKVALDNTETSSQLQRHGLWRRGKRPHETHAPSRQALEGIFREHAGPPRTSTARCGPPGAA